MSQHDSDIEFDFFEEPEAREAQPTERVRIGGPRGPKAPRPPTPVTPLLRLLGLIAFAILVIVLLVFWVKSCTGNDKHDAYAEYMDRVQVVATGSARIGQQLASVLTTPGIKAADLQPKIANLALQQQQQVNSAETLKPPGPLRAQQQELLESLQFRVSGLQGLAATFGRTARSNDIETTADLLAIQAQRLLTSDVVWDDLFRARAIEELQRQGVGGVRVPDSNFVQSSDLSTARGWTPVLQRVHGAATGGTPSGLHGMGLVATKALPGGQQLSTTTENTVTATTDLGFEVTVEDTGDNQEVQVIVVLTIRQNPAIVKKETIDEINAGEQKTVVFKNLGQVQFATKTTVRVDVQPVPGESRTDNNSAEYPVIFSLG